MTSLSVIYLVKNPPLDRLALQVEYMREVADQFVFVVDNRSTPETWAAIKSWPGTETVGFDWVHDYSAARNAALPLVKNRWTLCLDPDELPSLRMMEFLREVAVEDAPDTPAAYVFWTLNWWGGFRGGEEPYHWHIRLWQSGRGRFYRQVHELVMLDGREEASTRGSLAVHAPKEATLLHSKASDLLLSDQAYYESLGERSL